MTEDLDYVETPIGSMTMLMVAPIPSLKALGEKPQPPEGFNRFVQRIPNWVCTGAEGPPTVDFKTLDELLSNEIVQRYTKWQGFERFVQDDGLLMIEQDGGDKWWVVGYVYDPTVLESLPRWSRA